MSVSRTSPICSQNASSATRASDRARFRDRHVVPRSDDALASLFASRSPPAPRVRVCAATHETPPIMKSVKNSCGVLDFLAMANEVFLDRVGTISEAEVSSEVGRTVYRANAVAAEVPGG